MTAQVLIQQVLLKRGNTAVVSNYTGPVGEVVIDTDLHTLRVQDALEPGGYPMASEAFVNTQVEAVTAGIPDLVGNLVANTVPASDRLVSGNAELVLENDGEITSVIFPARDTGRIGISGSEITTFPAGEGNYSAPLVLSSFSNDVWITANGMGPRPKWEFKPNGTINVPVPEGGLFTLTLSSANFNPREGKTTLTLSGAPWVLQGQIQRNGDGTAELQLNQIFPKLNNPGYESGDTFTFNDQIHHLFGFDLEIGLADVVQAGPAGWTANLQANQLPDYPSTFNSEGAIKLTANENSWVFDVFGNLTLPAGGDIVDSDGNSVLGGGGGGGGASADQLVNGDYTLSLNSNGTVTFPGPTVVGGVMFSADQVEINPTAGSGTFNVSSNPLLLKVESGWFVSGPGMVSGVKTILSVSEIDNAIIVQIDNQDGSEFNSGDNPDNSYVFSQLGGFKISSSNQSWIFDPSGDFYNSGKIFTSNLTVGGAGDELDVVEINGNSVSSTVIVTDIGGDNDAQLVLHRHSTTRSPVIYSVRSNSNDETNSDVENGMSLLSIIATGTAGVDYKTFAAIELSAADDGVISGSNTPGKIDFQVSVEGDPSRLTTVASIKGDSIKLFDFNFGTDGKLTTPDSWRVGNGNTNTSISNDGFANPHDLWLRSGSATFITTDLDSGPGNQWMFSGKNIQLPNGGDIVDSNGTSVLGGTGGGISIGDFGEGFSLNGANKIVTNKLYSTNETQSTQHYRLELDTNGVVHLPDQSIINGATLKTVSGGWAGITAGPVGHDEDSWVYVDNDGAWIATKYSTTAYTWKFDNNGYLNLPGGTAYITSESGSVNIQANGAPGSSGITLTSLGSSIVSQEDLTLSTAGGAYDWTFGADGKLTLANGADISSSDIGFSATFPSNGPGGTSSEENSLTVGIANPAWADAILANPSGHYIQFESEDYSVNHTITSISGPAPGTNVYTLTGTWPADGGAFPIVIASYAYVHNGVTDISSVAGVKIHAEGGTWNFGGDGTLTLPNGGQLGDVYGGPLLSSAADKPVTIWTDNGMNGWEFGADGILRIQTYGEIAVENDLGVRIGSFSTTTAPNSQIKIGGADHAFEIFGGPPGYSWQFDTNGILTFPGANGFQATFGSVEPIGDVLHSINDLVLKSDHGVTIVSGEGIDALETSYNDQLTDLTSLLSAELYGTSFLPASHDSIIALAAAKAVNPLISDQIITVAQAVSDAWDAWQEALSLSAVTIGVGNLGWYFNSDGNLTLPAGGDILDSDGNSVLGGGAGVTVSDTSPAGDSGALWFNTTDARTYVRVSDTWIDAAPQILAPVSTYLGNLTVEDDTIYSDLAAWRFGADGNLTLPAGGTISYTPAAPGNWAGDPPTTIQEALDRLAALNPGA